MKHLIFSLSLLIVIALFSSCNLHLGKGDVSSYKFPHFDWEDHSEQFADMAKPVSYVIQIATDRSFSTIIDLDTIALSRYVRDQPFMEGTYYWRVRSITFDGKVSKWSKIRMFAIESPQEVIAVVPPGHGEDCTESVQAAVREAEQLAASGKSVRLVFPAGDYNFGDTFSGALIELRGVSNIEIEGTGATLIFPNRDQGLIKATACENISISGFNVTYPKRVFRVQGFIEAVYPETRRVVVALEEDSPGFDASSHIARDIFILLDPEIDGRLKDFSSSFYRMESYNKNSDGTYTIQLDSGGDFSDWEVGGRFVYHFRGGSAIFVDFPESRNVTAFNLTTDGWGQMGFVSVKGSLFNILHCNTVMAEGKWMMGNADGVHIREHVTGPWIEGTHIQGLGDDGLALYARPMVLVASKPEGNPRAAIVDTLFFNLEAADEVSFFEPLQGKILLETTIVSVQKQADGRHLVLFSDELPDGMLTEEEFGSDEEYSPRGGWDAVTNFGQVQDRTQIWNRSKSCGEFVIRNSRFTNIRRFGSVFRAKRGLIESNHYTSVSRHAINFRNETQWPNGLYASEIIIRNNVIRDSGFDSDGNQAAISFIFERRGGGVVQSIGARNILIDGNTFQDCPSPVIALDAVSNVVIRNNKQINEEGQFVPVQYRAERSENIQYIGSARDLEAQFLDPPLDVRPSAFWPWIGGHITKEGIKADLEAMKASGMRGGIIFDLNMYIPEGDVAYGSQKWQDLVDYAIATGYGMGLEIGFHNCPGWATSGGPWVTPEQSMKRMVFTETKVVSPVSTPIELPMPAIREGFYRDVAVLAIPEKVHTPVARISFAGQDVSGLQGTGPQSPIPVISGEPAVFTFTFEAATVVNTWALDLAGSVDGTVQVVIEASMDGIYFTPVATFHAGGRLRARTPLSHSFGPAEGRVFRVAMTPPIIPGRDVRLQVAGLGLLPDARIQNHAMLSLGSTSSAFSFIPEELPSTDAGSSAVPEEIIDLTGRMASDGTLSWNPPPGTWTLIRFGFTSTGAKNRPSRKDAQGLEVDKMDADAVRRFFADAVLPVLQRAQGRLPLIAIDSWEAGISNWTDRFPEEFRSRRGYDILPFLPVLTGRFVGSPAESYAFLHDFRITITDLVAEKYYSVMQEEAHRSGARLFVEPYAGYGMDEFRSGQYADLVAGEFWLHDLEGPDCEMNRSVRITSAIVETMKEDKRLTAEAFTSRPAGASWRRSPRSLKQLADCALINGINDFTFHSFVHQPRDDMQPGFTHGRYGTEFVRHNTWWPMAIAFNDYLARCGLMLRQGNRIADFLFLRNEGPIMDHQFPDVPQGYDFLYIVPFTLLESKVEKGRVITPGGGKHPVLVLPLSWVADIPLLDKLIELKEGGVAVLGGRPVMPAGRMDLMQRAEWVKRVDRVFRPQARPPSTNDLKKAVQSMRIAPSFSLETPGSPLECVHRHADGLDIFFVRNTSETPVSVDARFRASSETAQFWNPLDGSVWKAPMTKREGSLRSFPIDLPASGSVFVVFGAGETSVVRETARTIAAEIQPQEWKVTFNTHTGESFTRAMSGLLLWNESNEEDVRYFSGIAVYESSFDLQSVAAGARVVIDLGVVYDMARVRVNGREAGVCWTPPDRLDITGFVRPGANRLEIEVANTWVNRLIGDESLPPESEYDGISNDTSFINGVLTKFPDWYRDPKKVVARQRTTFVIWQHYDQNMPLVPSGLAGPVAVRVMSAD